MAQKETQLLNSSHSPLEMGGNPRGKAQWLQPALCWSSTGGRNHLALVQSPSPQHTPTRGTVLNKRETEAQRPAPALQTHRELPSCSLTPSTCNRARNCAQLSGVLILRSNHKTSLPPPAASPPTASSFPDITKFSLNKAGARSAWLRPGLHLPLAPEEPSGRDTPEQPRCKRLSSLKPHITWAGVLRTDPSQGFPHQDRWMSLSSTTGEQRGQGWGAPATAPLAPIMPRPTCHPPQDHSFISLNKNSVLQND